MSMIASAVIGAGTAVLGAVSSRNAAKKAANTARETSDAQIAFMKDAEQRARGDINRLIPQATDARLQGQQRAMDLLSAGAPMAMNALQQGNVGAQNVLAGAAPQIQNAIMGGPVDYSFMAPQQVQADLSGMLAGVPQVYDPMARSTQTQNQTATQPMQGFMPNAGMSPFNNLSQFNLLGGVGGNSRMFSNARSTQRNF